MLLPNMTERFQVHWEYLEPRRVGNHGRVNLGWGSRGGMSQEQYRGTAPNWCLALEDQLQNLGHQIEQRYRHRLRTLGDQGSPEVFD